MKQKETFEKPELSYVSLLCFMSAITTMPNIITLNNTWRRIYGGILNCSLVYLNPLCAIEIYW